MPLPIATIGLSLAAAGLKIFGGESKLLEFAAHPLDVAAGHLGAENILELAERLRKWRAGNERIENEDLEKAVARSALLADLFCLLDASGPKPGGIGPWSQLRDRFKEWLPDRSLQGIFSRVEEAAIRFAIEACDKQLKELEDANFVPAGIDPQRLILPEQGGDWGAKLANDALEELQREHAMLPERLQTIFRERWFPYLCLAFQEQIKTNARVSSIFHAMQVATGFVHIEEVVRGEHAETRRLIREISLRPPATPVSPYASVRALNQNYVDRPELQDPLRDLLLGAGRAVALTALQGMGGIGKTELALKLCHDPKVREAFPDGIVWLEIGRESGKTVLDRMKEVAEKLNDDPTGYTATSLETRYRSLLSDKAVLMVLDDVWSEDDVKPFIPDSPRCRLLFTTRIKRIAAEIGATDCTADLLSDAQSRALLARYAGLESDRLPPESADIIVECGNLPHGLSIVGAALRGKPPSRWADILEKLRYSDVPKVLVPTAVSVDEMGKENRAARERYLQLAVLLEDMVAPDLVLRTLWGVDAVTARDTVDELESRSMALRDEGGLRIHNLQMDYVRSMYPHSEALSQIHEALRLSSHVVEGDAAQFASQMVGRLLPYEDRAGIREFLERIGVSAPRPWLRPLTPALTPPGMGLIRTLVGHTHWVFGVDVSADGKVAVSASADRTLKVWDVESGRECWTLQGHARAVRSVAVSADGKLAVSASDDRMLKVWDVDRGRERRTLKGHADSVSGVALSADGKVAVSASWDRTLKVWDVDSGLQQRTLAGHAGPVHGVALSADGKAAVSACDDGTLKVWDVDNGLERRTLAGHTDQVRGVALSADGKLAVSASLDGTLKVWDVESGQERRTLRGHTGPVHGVALSANGEVAVSASWDQMLKVWDVASGQERLTLQSHTGWVHGVAVSADGKAAVSASEDKMLKVWDVESRRECRTLRGHSDCVSGVALSGDGKVAISASDDGTLKVWDVDNGLERRTLAGHTGQVSGVALNADGKLAISAYNDGALRVWEVESGRAQLTLTGYQRGGHGVALSADGKVAVSPSDDGSLRVWDVDSGQERRTLQGHTDWIEGVALSADGKVAVSASHRTLKVWNVESGQERRTLQGRGAAVSADGKVVVTASADGMLKVWDVDSGQERRTFRGYTGPVSGAAVSADGKLAVSASTDHTLKLWEVESGTCLATFSCDGPARCCAVASGVIAAGDAAGRVYLLALEREETAGRKQPS